MNKVIYRIAGLVVALTMVLGNIVHTKAAGSVYYVSPTGSDTNPGTSSAPFKTFAKANNMLTAGSTLNIYAGVYTEQLKITKSGTSSAGITVQSTGGVVVIDRQNTASAGLDVRASYVTVNGLEVKNSNDVCVNLLGSSITINGLVVHECSNHGIQANNSSNIKILNSRIYRTVLSNAPRILTGGWGSAIKVRVSDSVLIQGNTIYNNFGEGMGTRGTNITIRGNTVYDNYSVNIYTNSENAVIERNFVYCTLNSGYERSGQPAAGISMGEEYFDGWGARLKNTKVINNIIAFCKHGVRYNGAEDGVTGGGLKSATVAYNTIYGSTSSALGIVYESAQSGNLIANNIIWQGQDKLTAIENPAGLTFQNNLWNVLPPTAFRSAGDKIGDPKFANTPGYKPETFLPSSISPAAKAAMDVGITNDFYAKQRGPTFDIGAMQFASSISGDPGAQPGASPTPTAINPTPIVVNPTSTPVSATPIQPTATAQTSLQEATHDNKQSAFIYSSGWVEETSSGALGGSYARTSANQASVTFPFTGQSFSVIYKGGPSYRNMDVYVDGALVGTINQKHSASTYKARWDYTGQLSAGQHTLKLVFVTTQSSTNGSVDAVIVRSNSTQPAPTTTTAAAQPSPTATSVAPTATSVPPTATGVPAQPTATTQPTSQPSLQETQYDSTQSTFVYSSGWVQETSAYAIGGSYARTSTNKASVSFTFTGQSFSVIYKGGPAYRTMDVYVDGVLVGTINQRHDASTYKARWDYTGQLSAGQHTLKLVFVTTQSSTYGSLDAVIVR